MTEKEFLLDFINEIEAFTTIKFHKEETERGIDLFLEAQHKEYYEVEFIKKDSTEFYGIPLIFDPELKEDSVYLVKGNTILGVIKDIEI